MAKVELEGFQGNQMDGDGVTGEGIYCQHVEALRLLPFEESCKKRKSSRANLNDKGIDFVEGVLVSRLAIGGNRAYAEANDAHAERPCAALAFRATPIPELGL